jgi:crossover junction endodeoxyribonuclease RuvC
VIEDVRPRAFGNGGKAMTNSMHSQGSMMRSRGIVEAVADIARLEIKVVQPQTWKRFYGLLGKDKGEARELACRLYPGQAPQFKRVKDHNRADATLLAHYGQGKLT